MAVVKPFKALRPQKSKTNQVAALPYDVYNRKEAKNATKDRPLSFLRIDRAEMNFPDDYDMYSPDVYQKAKELLEKMINDGDLVLDDKPCYYIYELTMDGRSQSGIVAVSSVEDYNTGVIKKHENTRREKEEDRVRHVDTTNAHTGPIFLAYRDDKTISSIVERIKNGVAAFDFTTEDDVRHRGFVIDDDADIKAIREAFSNIESIYIADGHHRAASAVRVGNMRKENNPAHTGEEEYNFFLSVLFPDSQLKIMDYNRVVKDLNGLSTESFLEKIKEISSVSCEDGPVRPSKKGEFGLYVDGKWYRCCFNKELLNDDPVKGLDVYLLQEYVLLPILGIKDPKTDDRIDFVGGIRGLSELEKRANTDCKCAFSMYPTDISELFSVSDANLLMPPKSTWFEPKLRSGLFIHLM